MMKMIAKKIKHKDNREIYQILSNYRQNYPKKLNETLLDST